MRGNDAWGRLWFVWVLPALVVVANVVWLAGLRGAILGSHALRVTAGGVSQDVVEPGPIRLEATATG